MDNVVDTDSAPQVSLDEETNELHSQILDSITTRKQWENNLEIWYEMRHDGLKRVQPPWPGASDMHDPIADTVIANQKPNYIEQLYTTELICQFRALRDKVEEHQDAFSRWFDWKVKVKSNFPRQLTRAVDCALQNGKGILRAYWDDQVGPKGRICFESVDLLYFIVPGYTDRINDEEKWADWICQVEHYSVDSFLNRPEFAHFTREEAERLATDAMEHNTRVEFAKAMREGLTWTSKARTIIVWRVYKKELIDQADSRDGKTEPNARPTLQDVGDGDDYEAGSAQEDQAPPKASDDEELAQGEGEAAQEDEAVEVEEGKESTKWQIKVKTFSPNNLSVVLREDFYLSDLDDEYPFAEINREEKDPGFYSSRGIPELTMNEEVSNTRMLNFQDDWVTLAGRPIYSTNGTYGGANNIKLFPGQIFSAPLTQVSSLPPPVNFAEIMEAGKQRAEQRAQSFNFVQDQGAGAQGRTATEANIINAYQQKGDTLNSRLFRMDLGQCYRIAHKILCNKSKEDLEYFYEDQLQALPEEAISEEYELFPNGSGDNFNKTFIVQKAVGLFQMMRGNPNVKQDELTKMTLEAFDSRLVTTLYQDNNDMQAGETERQGMENVVLNTGTPVSVKQNDVDDIHLLELARMVHGQAQAKEIIQPAAAHEFIAHASGHLQALQKKNPQAYQQMNKQLADVMKMLAGLAAAQSPGLQQSIQHANTPGPGQLNGAPPLNLNRTQAPLPTNSAPPAMAGAGAAP